MAQLLLNDRIFDIELVVFDKDGTLIDFHHLWGQKAMLWVECLVQRVGGGERLREALYRTVGYDPKADINIQRVLLPMHPDRLLLCLVLFEASDGYPLCCCCVALLLLGVGNAALVFTAGHWPLSGAVS